MLVNPADLGDHMFGYTACQGTSVHSFNSRSCEVRCATQGRIHNAAMSSTRYNFGSFACEANEPI